MGYARTDTAALCGTIANVITVKASVTPSPPRDATIQCLGLSGSVFNATQTRVRSALANSAIPFPTGTVAVNIATPDGPNYLDPLQLSDRAALDLAIAVAILCAAGTLPADRIDGTLLMAELGLDGTLRPVPGIRPALEHAAKQGFASAVVAPANANQAAIEAAKTTRLTVVAPADLATFTAWMHGQTDLQAE